ncbi:biosynthetic-type acetolactate synthase large subunit [Vallitalea guaymasensis]|uniref:Acetolactate synthase n=1 Tax=Vallitalea guaymasensis TaxID=1185412 RepID=A0A8J8MDR5_9FIRM|nr:biosynthetic-type acetolactate synthase large subunit [Vallitalea guaymasensis]QUH30958.1 biosynthetic-type acetolactate synthase large subunit [Vallitalea guaymasensis]
MKLTGAQIVIECLKEQSVDTVFGYPGGAVLNIYDEIYKNMDSIKHILTSHEQGASHAADGYARSTGKVGVVIATSGPGATNLVTGIATAYMDSVPMVAITGNVPVSLLGRDSFQEVDITGVTMPITKHNYIVKDVNDLADIIREAFYTAKEGRPGPVLIDIPKDVTANQAEYEPVVPKKVSRCSKNITTESIEEAIELIKNSKKPYIYAGGGVIISEAAKELKDFAEKVQAPVTCSLMGIGGFPTNDDLYTGMIGMHGSKASNLGVTACDLLIVVGARFSDRVIGKPDKFANKARVLQIDVDPAEVNKNILTYHSVIGDIKKVLQQLNDRLEEQNHTEWLSEIKYLKEKYPLKYPTDCVSAQYAIEKLDEITEGEAIITTEVGQHQMWAGQYYKFKEPRKFLTSGGLGTMGYGFGACLGAKVGNPDKIVVNIAGDGSFRMNFNELLTAVRHNIKIIVLVINNGVLGMVRQWQTLFYDERYSFTTLNQDLDYVKLAESMGAVGFNITSKDQVEDVFKKAIEETKPVIINCVIDKDDKVFPMVAPGKPIEDVIVE